MEIQELQTMYAGLPQVEALAETIEKQSAKTILLEGLVASSAPMLFSALALRRSSTILFILRDADEAGYFYHDLTQIMGQEHVLFFPSSYRRAVKYGQRDAASEILRTEALAGATLIDNGKVEIDNCLREDIARTDNSQSSIINSQLAQRYIVSYPEAVAELVVSRKRMDSRTLELRKGQTTDVTETMRTLRDFGFREVDYVYEPGQFALRGSILDVFSYSCEYPFRVDFFGDEIDSIRTFEVDTQLSRDRRELIQIVPELAGETEDRVPLLSFLPADTLLVMKDGAYIRDAIGRTYEEGFSQQAIAEQMEGATEMEQRAIMQQMRKESQLISAAQFAEGTTKFRIIEIGHRPLRQPEATIRFSISPQPLFHKNFDLLKQSLEDYRLKGYRIFILADSRKQNERLGEILGGKSDREPTPTLPKGGGLITQYDGVYTDCLSNNANQAPSLREGWGGFDGVSADYPYNKANQAPSLREGRGGFDGVSADYPYNKANQAPSLREGRGGFDDVSTDYPYNKANQAPSLREGWGGFSGRGGFDDVSTDYPYNNANQAPSLREGRGGFDDVSTDYPYNKANQAPSLREGWGGFDGVSADYPYNKANQAPSLREGWGGFSGWGGCSVFTPVAKTLHEGFADNDLRVCFFTDHQIFDRFHKYNLRSDRARSGKMALTLKEIRQFEPGDYVVHVDHGIGRFGGLVRMPQADGGYQEMIKIQYQNGDSIYVSIHSLYKVSKYKAQDNGEPPRLSHLGTGQWERLKERTKKKLKDIARDLIKLYARRRHERGFAFSADCFMQHELEAGFLYEDTPDQLKATNDVKADMERQRPMDRLVCGDVGFGKTEVAVRAAFKAACDSKQVAVLVPTTVLAYQHYQTFSGRLKDFPVRVDYLTRARSAKQTKELLKDLEDGKIDILIGTHKLIGKSVKFHDLGLLIIDEEQKFGVAVKEKLRQMKVNVDTLTMSATPIPRTLQFSLVGARDLSTIQTPPPNRYPIQTEIHTFGPEIIADAVNFEMSRNGQVYFVNNRISELTRIAEMIKKYVPDARIAIGHGQMKPEELEHIILDFANYDYDVLLSTTIVENGIDIPNANTIIINGAQNFGLSDLHQMRGRVGRGNRKAFCYLLAPPLSALPQESRRRLEALENFSDLGSGINIAMQDLDIRGAGNLLGAEQSGFIADLGYETYQKILNQAVAELKNDEFADLYTDEAAEAEVQAGDFVDDCALESDIEMYFPDRYVPSDSERMLLYRELDNLKSDDELEQYRNRLRDRFGDIPAVGEELMRVVPLRRLGKSLGCEKIMLKQGRMTLIFVSNPNSPYYRSAAFDSILNYITRNPRRCNLREQNGKRSIVIDRVKTVAEGVEVLKEIGA